MKRGQKIERVTLEQKGFKEKGYFAGCVIFGKLSERVLWNPQKKTIDLVYQI